MSSDLPLKELVKTNQQNKEKFRKLLEDVTKVKNCKRCELGFNEVLNKLRPECNYHQGSKKYFSCKGCGEDEYYSCCGLCSICKPGCSNTFHV